MLIQMKKILLLLIISTSVLLSKAASHKEEKTEALNILWIVTEDMGCYLPAFGDSTIKTPHLSQLASEGVCYTNVYSPSGVCAPSRAAIATGMYPSSIGANHMRTGKTAVKANLPYYEAIPPPNVKMLSQLLREKGYYCTNNDKTDYQFTHPVGAWNESNKHAHWRNRGKDQAFFSIFNILTTHESRLFDPYRKEELVSKDLDFPIPPYLPNTPTVRRDIWKMYNNIALMDRTVGKILNELKEDGLLEKTIIFFYADHGGPLPRQKRLLYDAGLKVPMIIRFPNKEKAGTTNDQLISFIDFVPSLLKLTGQKIPSYLQGQDFLDSKKTRKYIHAAADRFDLCTDAIRAVRDKRFKYIRNYRPKQAYYLPVAYRERMPAMQELLTLSQEGKLNEVQSLWFRKEKPRDELFDCEADPHEINNIANDPLYADKLKELSNEMDRWIAEIGDRPNLEEEKLIQLLWGEATEQPTTATPAIAFAKGKCTLSCPTEGATISYRLLSNNNKNTSSFELYQQPFSVAKGTQIEVVAHRIGFKKNSLKVIL